MQFLRNHYEKIILTVVLLGLAVAAAALPIQVSMFRRNLDDMVSGFVRTRQEDFDPVVLTTNRADIGKFETNITLKLAGRHNLFNPVPWKKTQDGRRVKVQEGNELGPGAIEIEEIRPLRFTIEYKGISGSPDDPTYKIAITDESAGRRPTPRTRYAKVGDKTEQFTLVEVRGPKSNPDEFDLRLANQNRVITLSGSEPFERVVGFAADMRYPPANQSLPNKRVGDDFRLRDDPSETYKIVAIDTDKVVLSADSTQKRTILTYEPGQQ